MKKTSKSQVTTTVVTANESFKRIIVRQDYQKNKVLVQCFVAGYRYNDGDTIIDILKPKERLNLVREYYNPFDPFACAIYTDEYIQLGYVPRIIAPLIAHNLERGVETTCTIKRVNNKEYHDDYVRIEIVIAFPIPAERH